MATTKKPKSSGDGCGFLLMTCFVTCCFLAINCALLRVGYGLLSPIGPSFLRNPKVAHAILFLGPLAMVFAQWWLVDWLMPARNSRAR
ncbi:MAG: hypothetical protein NXI22_01150 [bacterium]|nr:hypothetical protein [bacterium]